MHYLVCYKLEKVVALKEEIDLSALDRNCPLHLKKFLFEVGKNPITKIDKNYPSFNAVMDNFQIFIDQDELLINC